MVDNYLPKSYSFTFDSFQISRKLLLLLANFEKKKHVIMLQYVCI